MRFLKLVAKIEAQEVKAVASSFLFVVVLMSAYYILRPVRDAMASDWTDAEVSWLWTLNFFISTAVVAVYGIAVSRFRFRLLVPTMYGIFALTFVVFYGLASTSGDRTLIDKSFYVWVSVFSLFHISVFWSFMSDLFNKEQAGRLFSIIAVGASVGGLIGPTIPSFFSESLGTDNLMLIASVLLLIPIPIIFYLQSLKSSDLGNEDLHLRKSNVAIGGNPFSGFKMFFANPYLLAIGLFIFLYTGISSFVYFELKNLLSELSRVERTAVWAQMDLAVNTLSIATGLFATGRIMSKFGMPVTIALVPVLICIGLIDTRNFTVSSGRRDLTNSAARRKLRRHKTSPRNAIYSGGSRNSLQSKTGHRHCRLSRRRCANGLAVHRANTRLGTRAGCCRHGWGWYSRALVNGGYLSGSLV